MALLLAACSRQIELVGERVLYEASNCSIVEHVYRTYDWGPAETGFEYSLLCENAETGEHSSYLFLKSTSERYLEIVPSLVGRVRLRVCFNRVNATKVSLQEKLDSFMTQFPREGRPGFDVFDMSESC